jgi:hypothetical protein
VGATTSGTRIKARAGFTGATQINREGSGVCRNGLLDSRGAIVSETVPITIAVEIVLAGADA